MSLDAYSRFLKESLDSETVNKIIEGMDKEPFHCLRLNPIKQIDLSIFKDLEKHQYIDNAFYYKKDKFDAGKSPLHHAGGYYIQDASAMMVGKLLDVKDSDYVIDLCAAPGGKSTFVAPLIKNGLLVSNDISSKRSLDLMDNIERMGNDNVIVLNEEVNKIATELSGTFDKVILDAPCSGEGMFRKNDLVSNDWSIDKVYKLVEIQKSLIVDAYKLLKKDGTLIYSTCTFNKYENEEVIQYLLDHTEATIIPITEIKEATPSKLINGAIRLLPFSFKGEGHFICKIKRNEDSTSNIKFKNGSIANNKYKIFEEFEKKNFKYQLDKDRLFEYNNNIYYLPKHCLEIKNIHILRQGILLGEIEKDIFKPSHHLASSFNNLFIREINLEKDSKEIDEYIKGNTLKTELSNGFIQVKVNNIPLGLGKVTSGIIKNLYPKKLRKVGL